MDTNQENQSQNKSAVLSVPLAIIVAGIIIGGAILVTRTGPPAVTPADNNSGPAPENTSSEPRPVDENDHILGNPEADVVVIEYSDLECPFCKVFHNTMHRIVDEYGKTGKVAWLYRHFPLDQLHPKARKEAEATECATELGGAGAFWEYTDKLFKITPSNNQLDPTQLPEIAKTIGLNVAKFNECLSSGRYANRVETDLNDAIKTGGRGTPWSIVISKDGKQTSINGAEPYESVKSKIDSLLDKAK